MRENDVIEFVIKEENKEGRKAIDVRKKKLGYDIKSIDKNGNERLIEVKKRDFPKRKFVFLTQNEFMNFIKNENMWLYIVYKKKNGELDIIKLDREKVLKGIRPKFVYFKNFFSFHCF